MNTFAEQAFLKLNLKPQPIRWCHLHWGWDCPTLLTQSVWAYIYLSKAYFKLKIQINLCRGIKEMMFTMYCCHSSISLQMPEAFWKTYLAVFNTRLIPLQLQPWFLYNLDFCNVTTYLKKNLLQRQTLYFYLMFQRFQNMIICLCGF